MLLRVLAEVKLLLIWRLIDGLRSELLIYHLFLLNLGSALLDGIDNLFVGEGQVLYINVSDGVNDPLFLLLF